MLKEKWQHLLNFVALYKKSKKGIAVIVMISLILIYLLFNLIIMSKTTTGYTAWVTTINGVKYDMFQPIQVAKDDNNKICDVYKNNIKIGQIEKENVIFKGDLGYKLAIEKHELKKELDRTFDNIEIKPFNENGVGIYLFYIDPRKWNKLLPFEKNALYNGCMVYVAMKVQNVKKLYYLQHGTKILNSSNGEVLAEYSMGYGRL